MNFLQQAYRGRNKWWIWSLIIIVVAYPFYTSLLGYFLKINTAYIPKFFNTNTLLIAFISFKEIIFFILLLLGVQFLHKRNILSIITASFSIRWYRVILGCLTWAFFLICYLSLHVLKYPYAFQLNFELIPFLKLALVCFTLVLGRAAFIEIFFRGYLLQGLSMLLKRKEVALFCMGVIYTIVYGFNAVTDKLGYEILLFYFVTAIFTGIITLLDDGAEIAIGMQIATNIIALLYVTSSWYNFQTDAIFIDTSPPDLLYILYIPVLVFFPMYFWFLTKIYRWDNWKEKLLGKVEKPTIL